MKKILWSLIAGVSLLCACNPAEKNPEEESFAPSALIDVKAEPGMGEITFSWTNPLYYYYAELQYVNAKGEDVLVQIRDKSVNPAVAGGVTVYTLGGFTDTNTYSFTLTPYGPTFEAGPSTVVECAPDTDLPDELTDVTTEFLGNKLVFRWTNPTRYNYAIIEYTDATDKEVRLKVTSDAVDPELGEGHTLYVIDNVADLESAMFKITPYGFTDKPGKTYTVMINPGATPESPILGWFLNKDGSVTRTMQAEGNKQSYAVIAYVGSVEHYFNHFIAIALSDTDAEGEDISAALTWGDGIAAVGKYAAKHPVSINGTTYNTSPGDAYDVVSHGRNFASASATGDAVIGWRMPCVTDWRYIFEGLTAGNEDDAKASATSPAGVASGSPNNIADGEGGILKAAINAAFGENGSAMSGFYWTSSQWKDDANYCWYYRFDMSIWTLLSKTEAVPSVRAVFAY